MSVQWNSCEEKMPEIPQGVPGYLSFVSCLTWSPTGGVRELRWASNTYAVTAKGRQPRWEEANGDRLAFSKPTHWAHLPAGPDV